MMAVGYDGAEKPSLMAEDSSTLTSSTSRKESEPCLDLATRTLRRFLEAFFYRLGLLVGRHPKYTVALSLLAVASLGAGLSCWREEEDLIFLWTGGGSRLRQDALWVRRHFPDAARYEHVIVQADNVLQPEVLRFLLRLDEAVKGIRVDGRGWNDVCAGYHELFGDEDETRKRRDALMNGTVEEESSADDTHCLTRHILRLWNSKSKVIESLDFGNIGDKITSALAAGASIDPPDLPELLSEVRRDSRGQVVAARATWMTWMLKKDEEGVAAWEREFVPRVLSLSASEAPSGVRVWALAARSYDDGVGQVVRGDLPALVGGVALMLLFAALALGRCGLARPRALLALLGVAVAPLALLAAYGAGAALGFPGGPIHCILPFLLLALCVDDVFIILQALASLPKKHTLAVPERLAEALRQAGVAVTVTSLSNVAAFAAGAVTTVPALRWFCVHAAAGILALLALHVTFFAACAALDEARKDRLAASQLAMKTPAVADKESSCAPSNSCCLPLRCFGAACAGTAGRDLLQQFFSQWLAPWLFRPRIKIATIIVAIALAGASCYGVLHLQNDFDRLLYLQAESEPARFLKAVRSLFPAEGERAAVYLPHVDFLQERQRLMSLLQLLKDSPYVRPGSVRFWLAGFQDWLDSRNESFPTNRDDLLSQSSEFLLFSPEGHAFIQDVRFSGFPFGNFNITASRVRFSHVSSANTTQQREAMEWLRSLATHVSLPSAAPDGAFTFGEAYITWEANQAISRELGRNLGLTLAAVAAVTLLLLPNIRACFWVLVCVTLTLLEVAGAIYFWGLALELVTSLVVILAAGLAVDYAAHVAHIFVHTTGTRDERGTETLARIGPAVLNGGFSTFLAFALLADSQSYVFLTFFKLILAVVVFGLFQGLFFLPVVLSWCGPDSASETPLDLSKPESSGKPPPGEVPSISIGMENQGFSCSTPPSTPILPESHPAIPEPDYSPMPTPDSSRKEAHVHQPPSPVLQILESPSSLAGIKVEMVKPSYSGADHMSPCSSDADESSSYTSSFGKVKNKPSKDRISRRRPGRHLSAPNIFTFAESPVSLIPATSRDISLDCHEIVSVRENRGRMQPGVAATLPAPPSCDSGVNMYLRSSSDDSDNASSTPSTWNPQIELPFVSSESGYATPEPPPASSSSCSVKRNQHKNFGSRHCESKSQF